MVWPGDWTMKSVGPCPTFRSFSPEKAHAELACAGAAVGPEVPGIGLVGSGSPRNKSCRVGDYWTVTDRVAARVPRRERVGSSAAGVGFEPTDRLATVIGFQDRPV